MTSFAAFAAAMSSGVGSLRLMVSSDVFWVSMGGGSLQAARLRHPRKTRPSDLSGDAVMTTPPLFAPSPYTFITEGNPFSGSRAPVDTRPHEHSLGPWLPPLPRPIGERQAHSPDRRRRDRGLQGLRAYPADPQGGRERAMRPDGGRGAVRHPHDPGGAVRAAGPYQSLGPQGRGRDGAYPAQPGGG